MLTAIEMPSVVLDCLIFDLQRAGGISRYWFNVVAGLLRGDSGITFDLLIDTETDNAWGKRLLEVHASVGGRADKHRARANSISRYFAPAIPSSIAQPAV